jgi:cysteinyl-tRNA synthetase
MLAASRAAFIDRMNDDFNAPAALAVLQELTRQVNSLLNEAGPQTRGTLEAIDGLYRELGGQVLGIIPESVEGGGSADRESGLMQMLIALRAQARANKDWATSDYIRNQLKELGIALEDRPDGTIWKLN